MTAPSLSAETRAQMLAPGIRAVLIVAGLAIVAELATAAIPLHTGEVLWRVQAMGAILGGAPQLGTVLVLILMSTLIAASRRTMRATSALAVVFALSVMAMLPFFCLDFISARHLQPQSQMAAFDRAGLRVVVTAGISALALLYAGWRGWAASRWDKNQKIEAGRGLVVGQM